MRVGAEVVRCSAPRWFRPAQADVEAKDWAPDIDAEILILRLGQEGVGYVHIGGSGLKAVPGIEVVAHPAAHHVGEGQILSLGIFDSVRPLGVDIADAAPHLVVRHNLQLRGIKLRRMPKSNAG